MVSGVWVCAWIARNCERSAAISGGVRPAERRRSKPRGWGVVVVGDTAAGAGEAAPSLPPVTVDSAFGFVAIDAAARATSSASSAGESASEREQWM